MKLVNESLFEFKKGLDPVDSLGMGRSGQIREWLHKIEVFDFIINDDFTIDSNDYVYIDHEMEYFPEFIQFNNAFNNFYIGETGLKSLRGCPKYVDGNFYCYGNRIKNLTDMPIQVSGLVDITHNPKKFTERDIRRVCIVGGNVYV